MQQTSLPFGTGNMFVLIHTNEGNGGGGYAEFHVPALYGNVHSYITLSFISLAYKLGKAHTLCTLVTGRQILPLPGTKIPTQPTPISNIDYTVWYWIYLPLHKQV